MLRWRSALIRLLSIWAVACLPHVAQAFGFSELGLRAKRLAESPFVAPDHELPKELQNLDYDHYRDIRFKPGRARWRGADSTFELSFFHRGGQFIDAMRINEITDAGVTPIRFNTNDFDYGANKFDVSQMRHLGFAGFSVRYPINTPKYKDEVLVFLGASYFRALGKHQVWGLSARGLAVDTAQASGEEFPRFTEFWIQRPLPGAKQLLLYGLLDSPRLTGAYRFLLKPGADTLLEVKAQLYLRDKVAKLGLAPLNSMYFYGENLPRANLDDYRPEVHDSDGLQIHSGSGEWIWRPLVNPRRLLVTSFAMQRPLGFGLMQRDRKPDHYEDLETRYDLRPSAWVEPKSDWGAGRVELVSIPMGDETNDNIVAYWVPDRLPQPGQPYNFEYRLFWQKDQEVRAPNAWVIQTRRGRGYTQKPDNSLTYHIDFEGPAINNLPDDTPPEALFSADGNGELLEKRAYRNDITGGWRVTLRVRRLDDNKPIELRGVLRGANNALSETWSYIVPPS